MRDCCPVSGTAAIAEIQRARTSKKFTEEQINMQISQFFLNGDIKGAIAYMRDHEEFKDILPAYAAIFEDCKYRTFEIPDMLNDILRLYQIYFRDTFYCGLSEADAAGKLIPLSTADSSLRPRSGPNSLSGCSPRWPFPAFPGHWHHGYMPEPCPFRRCGKP